MTSDCIEWQGTKTPQGYGRRRHKGKVEGSHRVAYCEANGIDIENIRGLAVRHRCDNPSCVNPDHLELGTWQDNIRDRDKRNRTSKGESRPNAVLTEEAVTFIRDNYSFRHASLGCKGLASKFGVSPKTISQVVNKTKWRHL